MIKKKYSILLTLILFIQALPIKADDDLLLFMPAILASANRLKLTDITPAKNATINSPSVIVKGTIVNASGNETSVIVNYRPTFVYKNQFIANIPIEEGTFPIVIKAEDEFSKKNAETSITINAVKPAQYTYLIPNESSGVSPFETYVEINTAYIPQTTSSNISCTGPGNFEVLETGDKKFKIRITGSGVHYINGTVTDENNNVFSNTIPVIVYDRSELDAMLKAKWNNIKTNLNAKNIEAALINFTLNSREKYNVLFSEAASASLLTEFVANMENIEMVSAKEHIVKYRIYKDEIVNGQSKRLTYYIYFARSFGGLWRILDF